MSFVTDVTIDERGHLIVHFGECCEKDRGAIGDLISGSQQSDDLWDDQDGNPAQVYPCGKADAIIETMIDVAQAAWDAKGDSPLTWVGQVRAAVPGVDLSASIISELVILAAVVDGTYGESEVFDTVILGTIKNQVSAQLDPDTPGITDDEWNMIQNTVVSNFVAAGRIQAGTFFTLALQCIGKGDANDLAVLGSTNATADCSEPETYFVDWPLPGMTWSRIYDFRESEHGFAFNGTPTNMRYTAGQGWWSCPGATDDKTSFSVRRVFDVLAGTGAVTKISLLVEMLGDDNWDDANNNIVTMDNHVTPLIALGQVTAITGENPASAGLHLVNAFPAPVTYNLANDHNVTINMDVYHPPDTNPPCEAAYSSKVVAIAIGGTGVDPFTS